MFKGVRMILITVFLTVGLFSLSTAEESITITTYYPSPYGSYNDLYVANNVGIGTASPNEKLHIEAGSIFINGESIGIIVDAQGFKRVGFMKYSGREAGIWTLNGQDFEIGHITSGTLSSPGGYSTDMYFNGSGNVGIGTIVPTAKLYVNGNIKATVLNNISGGSSVKWDSGTYEIGRDIAELFEANEDVEPGDVLSIDENGKLKKSSKAYDSKVAGVVSEAPAIFFEGSQLEIAPEPFEFKKGKNPPLALAGRVKCKVNARSGGPIKAGDLLVTSDKAGYAMKADYNKLRFGVILGKALEPLDSGDGKISVLVTLE